ncbi:MAG: hypothetical protein IKU12_05895 [Oscillospiraceae bacterium]|nr:hypothetical protein [Oscillospiraceae bacterium]
MKEKKLFLTRIVFIVAIVAMVASIVISGIAKKPTVTEGEFPYSITYSVQGEVKTLEGVYHAQFAGNESYADNTGRIYTGDDETWITICETEEGKVQIITHMYAEYLMGDAQDSDYFSDSAFEPELVYFDNEGYELEDEALKAEWDVEILEWDYPTPVENTLVFSHIAKMSGRVVMPLVIIALLALLAVLIFEKRDESVEKDGRYRFQIVLNIAIGIIAVPLFTIFGLLSDIVGIDGSISHQMVYLLSPVTLLGLAASVALRRKGNGKAAFVAQFAGIILLGIMLLVGLVEGYV